MVQKLSKNVSSILIATSSVAMLLVLRIVKISPLWGECFSYFSLTDVLMPLSGLGGFGLSLVACASRMAIRSLFLNVSSFALVYHIPGLCASFYWAHNNLQRLVGLIIPVLCMFLFIIHPVGRYAALYSMFWVIPMIISYQRSVNPFMKSLASTFIAHAVGSVLWLYTKQLTALEWLALIPVVMIERFTFACIMTAAYYAIMYAYKQYNIYTLSRFQQH